jgi:hypothetical protein
MARVPLERRLSVPLSLEVGAIRLSVTGLYMLKCSLITYYYKLQLLNSH